MKIATTLFHCIIFIFSPYLVAQEEGDYRTRDTGNWDNNEIWEKYNGEWEPVSVSPVGVETITVREGDSVYVNIEVTITGKLIDQGRIASDGKLKIGNGGIYQYDQNGGNMPSAIWEEGSTLLMTGVVNAQPGGRGQNYYNIVFDTPDLLANISMDLNGKTVRGDITVLSSGFGRWYLTQAATGDTSIVTLMGNVIIRDGAFSVQGTGNALTTFVVHHYGNIEVTGGNFSISRGSTPGGTTNWYIYEGDFYMENATTQNSTVPAGTGAANFVFAKNGTQRFELGENNNIQRIPLLVSDSTMLDMGASVLSGGDPLRVEPGGGISTSLAGGIAAIHRFREIGKGGTFAFNGTANQVTSAAMPDTVSNLYIDNPDTVRLSQETVINGVLRLKAGVFDNEIPFTLGPNGSISEEGGTLLYPYSNVDDLITTLPREFFVDQNYPNPFNPSTVIRFGLASASNVTVTTYNLLGQKIAKIFDGWKDAGIHHVQLDMSHLSSGMYLYQVHTSEGIITKRMMLIR